MNTFVHYFKRIVNIKKVIITKVIFSFLLLAIFSLVSVNVKNFSLQNSEINIFSYFHDDTTSKHHQNYFYIEDSIDEDSLSISEKEIEIEFEIEPFVLSKGDYNLASFFNYFKKLHYSYSSFLSKQYIPLYDLFCNWKFHLS